MQSHRQILALGLTERVPSTWEKCTLILSYRCTIQTNQRSNKIDTLERYLPIHPMLVRRRLEALLHG